MVKEEGMLGTGQTKIQLCNDLGVEQDVRTLEWIDLDSLCQVKFDEEYDTDNPIKMESGDIVYPIKGYRVFITFDIKYVTDVHAGAWETFMEDLAVWTQKIKVTPLNNSVPSNSILPLNIKYFVTLS